MAGDHDERTGKPCFLVGVRHPAPIRTREKRWLLLKIVRILWQVHHNMNTNRPSASMIHNVYSISVNKRVSDQNTSFSENLCSYNNHLYI